MKPRAPRGQRKTGVRQRRKPGATRARAAAVAVRSAAAPAPVGPYSQAVAAGGLLFLSGQIPLDPATQKLVPGEIEAQTARVIENLAAVLAAGGSSLAHVVRTTVYLTDLTLFARMNSVYARYFDHAPPPARATVQAAALPLGAQVEIDAIALRAPKAPPQRKRR